MTVTLYVYLLLLQRRNVMRNLVLFATNLTDKCGLLVLFGMFILFFFCTH